MSRFDFRRCVAEAAERIASHVRRTTIEESEPLSREFCGRILVKWENEQVTGSFKFRGALNKIRTIRAEQIKKGVVSASTGNHGLGVSRACEIEAAPLTLVLPLHVSPEKVRKLKAFGPDILFNGERCEQSEMFARRLAGERGLAFVSPYNDLDVIFGQGTAGKEIFEDFPGIQDVIVPLGGGGLISGIGGYLKSVKPGIRVYGVEPVNSAFMDASLKAGRIVDIEEKETVADGVAGGLEPGAVTFDLCREFVDEIILVEEDLIKRAMVFLQAKHGRMIEGAGALSTAGLMKRAAVFRGRNVAVVASGGNVSADQFHRMAML